MIFYTFKDEIHINKITGFLCFSVLVILFLFSNFLVTTLPLLGGYLIFSLALSKKIKLYSFAKHGDFSYGLYVYAFPVQQMITFLFKNNLSPAINFSYSYALCLGFAIFSWKFIEKPALRFKNYQIFEKIRRKNDS